MSAAPSERRHGAAGARLKRAALSGVVAALAIVAGVAIANVLIDEPLEVVGTRLDAGVILAIASFAVLIFKDTLLTIQKLGHYIWKGEVLSIGEAFVLLGASTIGTAILSVIALTGTPDCPNSWSECASKELDPPCFQRCVVDYGFPHVEGEIHAAAERARKRALLARIASSPLLFENASTRGARTEDGKPHLDEDSHGIRLQPDHPNQLKHIVALFERGCPQPEGTALEVIPSSSEARFKNTTEEISDGLNARAAELRGQNVEAALLEALRASRLSAVDVERTSWSGYLYIERTAIDGVHYDSLLDPQYQARSVIVRVKDPEACFGARNPPNPFTENTPTGAEEETNS